MALIGQRTCVYVTVKVVALFTVPPSVITLIFPVVAPTGTVILILVAKSLVIVAVTPWTVTFVAPNRLVPVMVTVVPTAPEVGEQREMKGGRYEEAFTTND